jgi:hypothetical protein
MEKPRKKLKKKYGGGGLMRLDRLIRSPELLLEPFLGFPRLMAWLGPALDFT